MSKLSSATVPIYASECAPRSLRGGLVMMWQMWTAFGIMLGYVFGLAFWNIGPNCLESPSDHRLPCVSLFPFNMICIDTKCMQWESRNWRYMLAIPVSILKPLRAEYRSCVQAIPPLIPMAYVFTLPESPRFLLQRAIKMQESKQQSREVAKLVRKAYQALVKFNKTELQATRELITIYHSLKNERMHRTSQGFKAISELWTHPRTRYAMLASVTVMFLQQLCGINVLAYYSTDLIQHTLAEKDLTSSLPSKASKIHYFELEESRELTDISIHSVLESSISLLHLSLCHLWTGLDAGIFFWPPSPFLPSSNSFWQPYQAQRAWLQLCTCFVPFIHWVKVLFHL